MYLQKKKLVLYKRFLEYQKLVLYTIRDFWNTKNWSYIPTLAFSTCVPFLEYQKLVWNTKNWNKRFLEYQKLVLYTIRDFWNTKNWSYIPTLAFSTCVPLYIRPIFGIPKISYSVN